MNPPYSPYAYLDASAIVKLVVAEPETSALEAHLSSSRGLVTSRVAVTEVLRAAGRLRDRRPLQQAEEVLESFVLIEPSPSILDRAGRLRPASLRALDAIHLATATSLDVLELEFIAYDERLAEAAAAHGLRTHRPR